MWTSGRRVLFYTSGDSSSASHCRVVVIAASPYQKIYWLHCVNGDKEGAAAPQSPSADRSSPTPPAGQSAAASPGFGANTPSQLPYVFFRASTSGEGGSDLCERDLVGVGVAVNVQDERVLVGVVLHDVVVHVHQDPEGDKRLPDVDRRSVTPRPLVRRHSPFFAFLVHFGDPLDGHAVLLRYLPGVREGERALGR